MKRILIIEDDLSILKGLQDVLKFKSYDVHTAEDGEKGYAAAMEDNPDLIILDIMLPRMDGFTLCKKLRAEGNTTPILMLTARGEEVDRVEGLNIGADDYVSKPFSLPELLARVRALLRRTPGKEEEATAEHLTIGSVTVDFKKYEAHRENKVLNLSPKEFGILQYLAIRKGKVVTRNELLDKVWGYELYPTTRTVDNHIAQLRSKIEKNPTDPEYLITVHGIGYKLVLGKEKPES